MTKKQLSKHDRNEIRRLLKSWMTHERISHAIGFSQSTVSRDIVRNSVSWVYDPDRAEVLCHKRRVEANKSNGKLVRDEWLRNKIFEKLSSKDEDWSPDTIIGRLRIEGQKTVCESTIYYYINTCEPWWRKYLRYKKRYKSRAVKEARAIWTNKKHISERPKIVEKRSRLWDVEIDTIVSKWRQWRCFTAFDRKSRYLWLRKVDSWKASAVYAAMIDAFSGSNIKTATSDNWVEFGDWELVEAQLKIQIYFATAYHSWERWTNENGNRCIRKQLPKKFNFSWVTKEEYAKIEHMLNHKPRKILNYRTPFEVHFRRKTRLIS
jgi:IS30 family transposase